MSNASSMLVALFTRIRTPSVCLLVAGKIQEIVKNAMRQASLEIDKAGWGTGGAIDRRGGLYE
ncbi:MAG: hypothetical protein AAF391_05290 [Bacteroidota bacterium]